MTWEIKPDKEDQVKMVEMDGTQTIHPMPFILKKDEKHPAHVILTYLKPTQYRHMYKTIDEYKQLTGYTVNASFKIGWQMARLIQPTHQEKKI